jgi:hypothetical protein
MRKRPVYDRMRNYIRKMAANACDCMKGSMDDIAGKSYKWDESADTQAWYQPVVDGFNFFTNAGMQSVGSTDGQFTIADIGCSSPRKVCIDVEITTELRMGSATRIKGTDASVLPDIPSGRVPQTSINFNIPFENRRLTWRWSECIEF